MEKERIFIKKLNDQDKMELIVKNNEGQEENVSENIKKLITIYDQFATIITQNCPDFDAIDAEKLKFTNVSLSQQNVKSPYDQYIDDLKKIFTKDDNTLSEELSPEEITGILTYYSNKKLKKTGEEKPPKVQEIYNIFKKYNASILKTNKKKRFLINNMPKNHKKINELAIIKEILNLNTHEDSLEHQQSTITLIHLCCAFVLQFNCLLKEIKEHKSTNDYSCLKLLKSLVDEYNHHQENASIVNKYNSYMDNFLVARQDLKKSVQDKAQNNKKMITIFEIYMNNTTNQSERNVIESLKKFFTYVPKLQEFLRQMEENQEVYITQQNNHNK
jgi:hypothetical protein